MTNLIRIISTSLLLAALAPLAPPPVLAETAHCRPWCVYYSGSRGGGTNCGFVTYEQCMWTAQGADICMPNGFCPPQPGAKGGPPGYGPYGYDGWSRGR